MKSRITIGVDFENGNDSVINVNFERSDDVRDNLVLDFAQKFSGQSSWCRADFMGDNILRIKPITAQQLPEQASLMNLMVNKYSAASSPTPPLPLHKPLDYEIPELLKELKFGRPAEAQGMIDTLIEAWEWMVDGGFVELVEVDQVRLTKKPVSKRKCVCFVNDKEVVLDRQSFGGIIYKHAGVKFSTHDLYLIQECGDDIYIEANETEYTLTDGDKFYTTKKQINNG